MSVIFAESVAITKSRLAKGFNGDSLNLNGKVISAQEADNGFKAAGRVKPPYIAVIASCNQKGFAAGAVSAFNDYVKDVNLNKYNAEVVIGRYFDDMQAVVDKCGIEGGKLSIGIVCAYDDCVIAAKSGDCHLLRFSEGELFEIALSDDEGGRGYQFVDVIANGDMFALIGEEAATDLDYDGIVNTFDSKADLKTMIKDFYKLLSESARGKDCSVVLIKLESDVERTYAATPLVTSTDDAYDDGNTLVSPDSFESEPPVETSELYKADDFVSDDENPETGKRTVPLKKKILDIIPIAVLVIILGIAAALFIATRFSKPADDGETAPDTNVVVEENEDGSDVDLNGSNGMQNVEDTEHGGDVVVPESDNTTTNQAPETTNLAPETTTAAPETTTAAPETTTAAPADDPVDDPLDDPADDPVDEPVDDPLDDPADEPVDEPVDDPLDDPADEPIDDPFDDPADEPVDEPVDDPLDDPADEPVDEPEDEPVDEFLEPDPDDFPAPDEPVDDPPID